MPSGLSPPSLHAVMAASSGFAALRIILTSTTAAIAVKAIATGIEESQIIPFWLISSSYVASLTFEEIKTRVRG